MLEAFTAFMRSADYPKSGKPQLRKDDERMNLAQIERKHDRFFEILQDDATTAFKQQLERIRNTGIPVTGLLCGMGVIHFHGDRVKGVWNIAPEFLDDDENWQDMEMHYALEKLAEDHREMWSFSFPVNAKTRKLVSDLIELMQWCINCNVWPNDITLDPA